MTVTGRPSQQFVQPWLVSRNWDLTFLIFSAVLFFAPYLVYVVLGGDPFARADQPGTPAYQARVVVNLLVAVLVGGPHMYATFTRTVFDPDFRQKRSTFLLSSLLIPLMVVILATSSYESYVWLLTLFFGLASLHALQQIVWLTDAYTLKARGTVNLRDRLVDYGLILSSLYPLALAKMVNGQFWIGPVNLKINDILYGQYWLAYMAGALFAVFFAAFIGRTVREYREGTLNVPKTLLILITATIMFFAPALPNLDTAFQGINVWHSFQYLALTWLANRLREEATGRPASPFGPVSARSVGWVRFYVFCLAMLPVSGLLILAAGVLWPGLHCPGGQCLPGADEAYTYIGILSVLLVHYFHDGVLFTEPQAIIAERTLGSRPPAPEAA
ncbi:MAG: hypothetical protein C4316_05000 [Chloroflexota bacterium]